MESVDLLAVTRLFSSRELHAIRLPMVGRNRDYSSGECRDYAVGPVVTQLHWMESSRPSRVCQQERCCDLNKHEQGSQVHDSAAHQ
ncbi:MAG: hypothetical protein AUJ92_21630 [Armatimonadetes bacterium CG2_30_59_28]|nr:MAG: hypothetical protein AUJ92_21630 [Armatimonadetes bacterium CG2_30_59_28]PIU60725.1 MAG: hypothetical protein COS85_22945 [Armatimonadetes bacterium CG07_land_8_20_14_0_80_59_28]PIX40770.1 MAG: hypothetical protein COZ56_13855 [Armatimonadetes bacterium CG_4_8_14_3_um_filter_58_9]PIY40485.1 MAG: hypothetical protein COZ05_17385 [Armatimonadetes bacterium CG_4_10_14_3_um_filter_59_10]PJB66823.1 MAG: hypothetical protein CO095_12635 [Armatimonadetes bacterium CG_4_9_14_3_um_filter_58_7]